jgi:hypothetical protein
MQLVVLNELEKILFVSRQIHLSAWHRQCWDQNFSAESINLI